MSRSWENWGRLRNRRGLTCDFLQSYNFHSQKFTCLLPEIKDRNPTGRAGVPTVSLLNSTIKRRHAPYRSCFFAGRDGLVMGGLGVWPLRWTGWVGDGSMDFTLFRWGRWTTLGNLTGIRKRGGFCQCDSRFPDCRKAFFYCRKAAF